MSALILILAGVWLIGVGYHTNGTAAAQWAGQQKAVLPWLLAVIVLWALWKVETLRPLLKPVITLAAVAIVLAQWKNIESTAKNLQGIL
jgi:hypothetical protein